MPLTTKEYSRFLEEIIHGPGSIVRLEDYPTDKPIINESLSDLFYYTSQLWCLEIFKYCRTVEISGVLVSVGTGNGTKVVHNMVIDFYSNVVDLDVELVAGRISKLCGSDGESLFNDIKITKVYQCEFNCLELIKNDAEAESYK